MNTVEQVVLEGHFQSGARKVLVVEDDPGNIALIVELLKQLDELDNQIVHASTLAEALVKLDATVFDAVLLDLRLPDASGVECVRTVREHANDVPIVVLTSMDDHAIAFACIAAGAQDFIRKSELQAHSLNRSVSYATARMGELVQRKRADALQRRLEVLEEHASDAIIGRSTAGVVTSWNRGAERSFGLRRDEVIGKQLHEIIHQPRDKAGARSTPEQLPELAIAESVVSENSADQRTSGKITSLPAVATALRDAAAKIFELAAICRDISEAKTQNTELKRRNDELLSRDQKMRNLAAYLTDLLEADRTRISREVHDSVGPLLTALKFDLAWMARNLNDEAAIEAVRERITLSESVVDQAVATVQEIAVDLRPSVLDTLGLAEAIRGEGRRFAARTGVHVTVDIRTALRQAQSVETTLFRILQELLTNIARHAHASDVSILLADEGGRLALQVTDNGIGIDDDEATSKTSSGLLGIRERAHIIGASFSIHCGQLTGTVASVGMAA